MSNFALHGSNSNTPSCGLNDIPNVLSNSTLTHKENYVASDSIKALGKRGRPPKYDISNSSHDNNSTTSSCGLTDIPNVLSNTTSTRNENNVGCDYFRAVRKCGRPIKYDISNLVLHGSITDTPNLSYTQISNMSPVTPNAESLGSCVSTKRNCESISKGKRNITQDGIDIHTIYETPVNSESVRKKHNLRNKSVLLLDIPILDFDVAEDDDVEIDLTNSFDAEAKLKRPYKGKWCYSLCCLYGKVQLPKVKEPPPILLDLFHGNDSSSKNFIKNIRAYNIRAYNMTFSFTSMGGKVDHSVNIGPGPYCFRLHGQNYHRLGSLLPVNDAKPKFSQLYVYDTDNEDQNRIDAISSGSSGKKSSGDSIDPHITQALRKILDEHNELVKTHRMVRDCYRSQENQLDNVKLKLVGRRTSDGRTYNLLTAFEIVVLIVGDIEQALDERDIVVESRNGDIQQINVLHPKFLSVQYPLLFPYGEDGYHTEILHRDVVDPNTKQHVRLTMREFMAYIIQERPDKFSLIHNSRRLFQQFLVDIFTMIETERMYLFRKKQKLLRSLGTLGGIWLFGTKNGWF
nr:hypothetical protein [Tanacetum cinerariifolium]